MKHLRLSVLSFLSIVIFSHFSFGAATDSAELVQSVPLETTLAVPGIRQTQEVWLEMIKSAQTTLDLEQFYISDQAGEALAPVLQAIQDAAQRGVHVRILIDSKFFVTYPEPARTLGHLPGIESKIIDFSSSGGVQHAKFFVVDRAQSFIGSQNFDWRALSHIHEIGIRIADTKIASDCETIFERDWGVGSVITDPVSPLQRLFAFMSDPTGSLDADTQTSTPSFFVAASPPSVTPAGIADSLSQVTGLMNAATKTIRIQVMEYATKGFGSNGTAWRALDDVIRKAAARGVHVQLLVDISDVKKAKADLAALSALKNIEVRTVTIPQWSGGVIDYARLIHSKYLIVDGIAAWVGSENWSKSYFTDTRDVGLVLHNTDLTGQLNQVFDQVWGSTYTSTQLN